MRPDRVVLFSPLFCYHPGNAEPSSEDLALTKQLSEAGKLIGIPRHDHIIVTENNRYCDLEERGVL
ncbi:MAG: JAB domain-containing protein [Ignavibacteriales bacterium]|nr:JAB domain-containing protein [Ignavibacteriales bacterium]